MDGWADQIQRRRVQPVFLISNHFHAPALAATTFPQLLNPFVPTTPIA